MMLDFFRCYTDETGARPRECSANRAANTHRTEVDTRASAIRARGTHTTRGTLMTLNDRPSIQVTLHVSIGAAIGVLLVLSIIAFPHEMFSAATVRVAVGVGIIVAVIAWRERQQARRHQELVRTIRYGAIAEEAERFLRRDAA